MRENKDGAIVVAESGGKMHKDRNWLSQLFHQKDYRGESFTSLVASHQQGKDKSFTDCKFMECKLKEFDFSGAAFTDCIFTQCELTKLKMNEVFLNSIHFQNCTLLGIDFSSCVQDSTNVEFSDCKFEECTLPDDQRFKVNG